MDAAGRDLPAIAARRAAPVSAPHGRRRARQLLLGPAEPHDQH